MKRCQKWNERFCSFETENLWLVVTRSTTNLHNFCLHDICSLMRDLVLALSTFPWTWNLTRKTDTQANLLQKNDLQNALLLNEKQTDESYQIFIPLNNINDSPVSGYEILPQEIARQIAEWSGFTGSFSRSLRCLLVCPLRTLVSRFQRRFFLKKCFSKL